MTRARYANAFKPHIGVNSPEPAVYETDARPETYRGVFLIYRRLPACFDLVLDGVCIGQRAGRGGAVRLADEILDNPDGLEGSRALRLFAETTERG